LASSFWAGGHSVAAMASLDIESTALPTDDDQEFLTGRQKNFKSWRKGALASALALGVGAACFAAGRGSVTATVTDVEQKYFIDTIPPMDQCMADSQDCSKAKCCKTAGHVCYEKDAGYASCMKEGMCTQGTCKVLKPSWAQKPALYKPGTSMFCYTAYIMDMGPKPPKNHQLELLQRQAELGTSIFACSSWKIYGDTAATIGGSPVTVVAKTDEWHAHLRKDKPGLWANAMIYHSIWQAMAADGLWSHQAWTVKVDPWSVFIPQRLINFLATQDVTQTGTYYDTCKGVLEGYFGNLEVASHQAMTAFLEQLGTCKAKLGYDGRAPWKFGPWGEDLFQQRCFDMAGVNKLAGYGLSNTGTCINNRPKAEKKNADYIPTCAGAPQAVLHPFKTVPAYFKCLGELTR